MTRQAGKQAGNFLAIVNGPMDVARAHPAFIGMITEITEENVAADNLGCMEQTKTDFGTNIGVMATVLEGIGDQITWPESTEFVQCRKAPSGHWLVVVSAWPAESVAKALRFSDH